jgi:hypothetical protein
VSWLSLFIGLLPCLVLLATLLVGALAGRSPPSQSPDALTSGPVGRGVRASPS